MIRVHVAVEKNTSSAMEDRNVGKKNGDKVMEKREVPGCKAEGCFELVDEV